MELERWGKIRDIFESALNVPESSRSTFLDTACRGDTGLRMEVEQLLHHLDRAGRFLGADDRTLETAFRIGQLVSGRYKIVSHLGSGAMGEVYEAEDEELRETVALKALRLDTVTPHALERLRREVRFARRVTHPNVCRLFDIGYEVEDDRRRTAYITMELVRGEVLSAYIQRRGGLPSGEALELAEQLCGALDAAHEQGIVHGDLKTRNILFAESVRRIVVVDFGLSRWVGAGEAPAGTLSQQVAGTPPYMAPEQFEGIPPSRATDIYSLGAILHELIAGGLPPARRDTMGRRELAPDLPEPWTAAITRCLSLDPSNRPATAGAVLQMLVPQAAGASKGIRRRMIGLGIAATLVLTIAAGVGYRLARARKTMPREPAAHGELQPGAQDLFNSARTYCRSQTRASIERAIGLFERGLARYPQDAVAIAQLAQAFTRKYEFTREAAWLEKARLRCDAAERLAPGAPETLLARAVIRRNSGELGAAIADLRKATELDSRNGEAWRQLARSYTQAGNILAAEETYQEGLKLNPSYWSLYSDFGWFYSRNGQYKRSEEEFLSAADLAPDQPIIFGNLGGLYLALGRLNEAERTLVRALQLEPSAGVASNLGTVYFQQKRFRDAARLYRQAADLSGNDYRLWANLGDALRQSVNVSEANSAYDRAIVLAKAALQVSAQDAQLLSCLSLYCAKRALPAESRDYCKRAVQLAPRDGTVLMQSGIAMELLGERRAALDFLREALQTGLSIQQIEGAFELERLRVDPAYLALAAIWGPPAPKRN